MTVRMSILIKLIICDYRTILSNGFFYVGIASVKFPGFVAVGGIRVRGIFNADEFIVPSSLVLRRRFSIFNNRLVRKASDKS